MAKKQDRYFEIFVEMSGFSCEAAAFLRGTLNSFNRDELPQALESMHAIEHCGDNARHTMTKLLAHEFITPIEREDIMAMSETIDDVTDKIEDVLQRLYMYAIPEIREDALRVADLIVKCTEALRAALREFVNFKKSKILNDHLIEINRLEEEGDRLYIEAVRALFLDDSLSPRAVVAWNSVFGYLENVCDACEDVANLIEDVIMKNT